MTLPACKVPIDDGFALGSIKRECGANTAVAGEMALRWAMRSFEWMLLLSYLKSMGRAQQLLYCQKAVAIDESVAAGDMAPMGGAEAYVSLTTQFGMEVNKL